MLRGERSSSGNATHPGLPREGYLTPRSQDAPAVCPTVPGRIRPPEVVPGEDRQSRSDRGDVPARDLSAPRSRRGGYMLLDCDDPLAVHKFCSMLPAFEFQARPVIPVMDAVRVELEAIAFRDGLKGK
jgi:hypothetical protein